MAFYELVNIVDYKGRTIVVTKDNNGDKVVFVDYDRLHPYCSVADAKRVIRGENPKFTMIS